MKIEKEQDFLVNEFLEGPKDELKRIVRIATRKPRPYDRKAAFLKEFTFGLLNAHRIQRFKELQIIKKVETERVRPKVEVKRVERPRIKERPEIKLDLPPPPRPKLEAPRDIIRGADGKVYAKAVLREGIYSLDEPGLSNNLVNVLELLKKNIGNKVIKKRRLLDDKGYLGKNIKKVSKKLLVSYDESMVDRMRYYLIRDLLNLGRVDAMVKDDRVSEIICDGAGRNVIVNYNGNDVNTNVVFDNDEEISRVVMNLAEKVRKKVDTRHPFLNVDIGNLRVQANIQSGFSGARFIIKRIGR